MSWISAATCVWIVVVAWLWLDYVYVDVDVKVGYGGGAEERYATGQVSMRKKCFESVFSKMIWPAEISELFVKGRELTGESMWERILEFLESVASLSHGRVAMRCDRYCAT